MSDSLRGKSSVFLHAFNPATGTIDPLIVDGATGALEVDATFSGTLTVAIDELTDSILIYGNDGPDGSGTNRAVFTDADGRLLTNLHDGAGTPISSETTAGGKEALDVNIARALDFEEEALEVVVGNGADVFASDVVAPEDGQMIFTFRTDQNSKFDLRLTRGVTVVTSKVERNATIMSGDWISFVFPVKEGDALNLSPATGGTITATAWFTPEG